MYKRSFDDYNVGDINPKKVRLMTYEERRLGRWIPPQYDQSSNNDYRHNYYNFHMGRPSPQDFKGNRTFNRFTEVMPQSSFPGTSHLADIENQLHMVDDTLPKLLRMQFQEFYCGLCQFQCNHRSVGKLHYISEGHMRNVREYLIQHSLRTGAPLHPLARMLPLKPFDRRISASAAELNDDPKYSHCNICRIDLNGRIQAMAHYEGKSHQRFENAARTKTSFNSSNIKDLIEDSLLLKEFDVPKTFAERKQALFCRTCYLQLNSDSQFKQHMESKKHEKMESAIQDDSSIIENLIEDSLLLEKFDVPKTFAERKEALFCRTCALQLNSDSQFKQHMESKKHERMESAFEDDVPRNYSLKKKVKVEDHLVFKKQISNNEWHCELCDIIVNNEELLTVHFNGQKHQKNSEQNKNSIALHW